MVSIESEESLTFFVLCQGTSLVEDETLRVDEVDALTRFIDCKSVEGEEAHELHSYTNAGRTGSQEQNAVRGQGLT
jgi:hypothetical protein